MQVVQERPVGPNGQAQVSFSEGLIDNIACNKGGHVWRFKNNMHNPVTVVYGLMSINAPTSQRYETFVVPGNDIVNISCTLSEAGAPVQIRRTWSYANTDYVPASLENPWDALLILILRSGARQLNNLHERQINVTIRKANGQEELRAIGPASVWGPVMPMQVGWSVIAASWSL